MPASPLYRCPGEDYSISRPIHLARLAAFYSKCRECPHCEDSAAVSPPSSMTNGALASAPETRVASQPTRQPLLTAMGIRGVYLNAINRQTAGEIAGALASLLWEASPQQGNSEPRDDKGLAKARGEALRSATSPRGPAIVVGHDERPSSRDLVMGVASTLRRMSCEVIDIGLATRPSFWHAAQHLTAEAGILATGSGCNPAWTGLDVCGGAGMPLPEAGAETDLSLTQLLARWRKGYTRSTRHSGSQRSFQAWLPYETGLWKYFHALRPLQVAVACSSRVVRELIERLFQRLPCRLISVETPLRQANLEDPRDPDVARVAVAVVEQDAHFGVLIGEEGQRVGVVDERGKLVPSESVGRWLANFVREESPGSIVWTASPDTLDASSTLMAGKPLPVHFTAPCQAAIARTMQSTGAVYGGGTGGEHWFHTPYPTCDAVITLAWMLQALSRSDAELSSLSR